MKVAVIGAGIIGITTAYELAKDGHTVTVLERRSSAAEESSFANAGIIAPSLTTPWARPGLPAQALRQLFSPNAPVQLTLPLTMQELAWLWRCYRSCRIESYLINRTHLQKLAFYSQARLQALTAERQLDYERSDGHMVLLRTEQDHLSAQAELQLLREADVKFKELTPQQALLNEPAINLATSFFGAIHLPEGEEGNCRQFALLLKNESQKLGVNFKFNTVVTEINSEKGVSIRLLNEAVPQKFDATVVCAGPDAVSLLRPLRLHIPLIPVHGFSVSATLKEPLDAPRSSIMDAQYQVSISRLGNRVRVSGCSQIGGGSNPQNSAALATLYQVLQDWFPGAAHLSKGVQEWRGARASLPDDLPILGKSGVPGVWLNLGQGANGWALSCGSARVVADQLQGKSTDIDIAGFSIDRLST